MNDIKNKSDKNCELKLTYSLKDNMELFQSIFSNDSTVIYRSFENKISTIKCCLVFIDGMVNSKIINEDIIEPIMNNLGYKSSSKGDIIEFLMNKVLILDEIERSSHINDIINTLVYGYSILLVEGINEVIIINTKGWESRPIFEPKSETVVRGSREGFTESLLVNLSLIRRRVRTNNLKIKYKELGRLTRTKICICYIEGIAQDKIIAELEKRLDEIEIDGILDSGYIEEFIKDEPLSPFKTLGSTERPDTIVGKLLEGRIAVLCDGTPEVLTAPFIFIEHFQVNEDYYNNFIFSSFNRIVRNIGFLLATSVPAIYVALTTFHQEMIPTPLLLSIYSAREGVPFPTVLEAMLMLLTFEILREAGVRLPKYIGQAVSIVGALVLGDAAVSASIVSAPMVIVTAITGISSFLLPKMLGGLIVIRIIFLLLASFLGLYGYIFGVIGLFIHLMSMKSFGIPYMLNTSPIKLQDMQDVGIRAPWWYMNYRTKLASKNLMRQKKDKTVIRRVKSKQ
jgi:spore germination protein KA